ncbi:hypothetical protein WA158_000996 [Blastocystis sp. Blastoise]
MVSIEEVKQLLNDLKTSNNDVRNTAENKYKMLLDTNIIEFIDVLVQIIVEQTPLSFFAAILLHKIFDSKTLLETDAMKIKVFEGNYFYLYITKTIVVMFFITNLLNFKDLTIRDHVIDIICQAVTTYENPLNEITNFILSCLDSKDTVILSFVITFFKRLPPCQFESLQNHGKSIIKSIVDLLKQNNRDYQYIGIQCLSELIAQDWEIDIEVADVFMGDCLQIISTYDVSWTIQIPTLVSSISKVINHSEPLQDYFLPNATTIYSPVLNLLRREDLEELDCSAAMDCILSLLTQFADNLISKDTDIYQLFDAIGNVFQRFYYQEGDIRNEDIYDYLNNPIYKSAQYIFTYITEYEHDNYNVYDAYLNYIQKLFADTSYLKNWIGLEMLKICIHIYIERYNISIDAVFMFTLRSITSPCPLLRYTSIHILTEFVSSFPTHISGYFKQIVEALLASLEIPENSTFPVIMIAICRCLQLLLVANEDDSTTEEEETVMSMYIERYMVILGDLLLTSSLKVQESIMLVIVMFCQLYPPMMAAYYSNLSNITSQLLNTSAPHDLEDLKGLCLEAVASLGKEIDQNPHYARCIVAIAQTLPQLFTPYLPAVINPIIEGCKIENYIKTDNSLSKLIHDSHGDDDHCHCNHDHSHGDEDECHSDCECECNNANYIPISQGGQGDKSVCTSSLQDISEYIYVLKSMLEELSPSVYVYIKTIMEMIVSQLEYQHIPMIEQARLDLLNTVIKVFLEDGIYSYISKEDSTLYISITFKYLVDNINQQDMSLSRSIHISLYTYINVFKQTEYYSIISTEMAHDLIMFIMSHTTDLMERKHMEDMNNIPVIYIYKPFIDLYYCIQTDIEDDTEGYSLEDDVTLTGNGIIHALIDHFHVSLTPFFSSSYIDICFKLISINDPLYVSFAMTIINDILTYSAISIANYMDQIVDTIVNHINSTYPPLRAAAVYCPKLLSINLTQQFQPYAENVLELLTESLQDEVFSDSLFTWSNENAVSSIIALLVHYPTLFDPNFEAIFKIIVPIFPFEQDEDEARYVYSQLLIWALQDKKEFIESNYEGVFLILNAIGLVLDNNNICTPDMRKQFAALVDQWKHSIPTKEMDKLWSRVVDEVKMKIEQLCASFNS